EYVAFVPLTTHARSGMPLTREYRIFWLDSEPILTAPYWDEGDYAGAEPPIDTFRPVATTVASRFFTMDVAQRADDDAWEIVELGDGQAAGIPERAEMSRLYEAIARHPF
ncbi:MAG TPA: ATP-grasp domain-containing protein, partial [Ktedonobacterales bacterium]|nr:ATP-grasp domain-containing protein [Ktedonobacterales bacterium]